MKNPSESTGRGTASAHGSGGVIQFGRSLLIGEVILPRLIRLRDAPRYLGMDPNRFNDEVRPYLVEMPIVKQEIAFDRLDLDAWVDQYKDRNGRPGKRKGVDKPWDARKSQVSSIGKGRGISTKLSEEDAFAKALARATSKKRKGT